MTKLRDLGCVTLSIAILIGLAVGLLYAIPAKAEVFRCPGNVFQDRPCGSDLLFTARPTSGHPEALLRDNPAINVAQAIVIAPGVYTIGRRTDEWDGQAQAMIDRYRWETRERYYPPYAYGDSQFRNRLQNRGDPYGRRR